MGKGREGGWGRIGKGGAGRDREEGGRGGMGEGRGARHGFRPRPLETSSGSAPAAVNDDDSFNCDTNKYNGAIILTENKFAAETSTFSPIRPRQINLRSRLLKKCTVN